MNRFFTFLVFSLLVNFSFAQEWKSKLNEARKLYQNGNYVESLKLYEDVKNSAPESIDFSTEMGQAAYKANDFNKAKSYYETAVSKLQKKEISPNQYHNLGNSQMKMKDYSSAIQSYKEALRKNPNDIETRYNLSEAIRKNKSDKKQQQPNNDNNNNKNQSNKPEQQPEKKNDQPADIPKRTVDRMLDKLSKKEADTKRKINNQANKKSNKTTSAKDW